MELACSFWRASTSFVFALGGDLPKIFRPMLSGLLSTKTP